MLFYKVSLLFGVHILTLLAQPIFDVPIPRYSGYRIGSEIFANIFEVTMLKIGLGHGSKLLRRLGNRAYL